MTKRFGSVGLAVGVLLLAVGWVIASIDPVPTAELDLTEAINDAPEFVATVLWPVMQLGSFAGPFLVAAAAGWWKRSLALGLAVIAGGWLAWMMATFIKDTVERGRPLEYLADLSVREGEGTGLGFVSGHTSVAFACATVLAPQLSSRGRVGVYLVAALVGLSRIVYGMHLPADVVGGAGLGVICGVVVVALVDRILALRTREDVEVDPA